MRTGRLRLLRALALASVLALVAAGCGGSGDEGADADCGDLGCVEVGPGETVRLGALLTLSGDSASLGEEALNGIRLAIDHLDQSFDGTDGRVLGHDVELVSEDDGCSAEAGADGARSLAGQDRLVGVVGPSCVASALDASDAILYEEGILLVTPSVTDPVLTLPGHRKGTTFRVAPNDVIQGAIAADFAYGEIRADRAATIEGGSASSAGLARAFRDGFEAQGGEIVGKVEFEGNRRDFRPLLERLKEGDPSVLYLPVADPSCAVIARQAKRVLPGVIRVASSACVTEGFGDEAGDSGEGVYATTLGTDGFAESYAAEFLPAYQAQFGVLPSGPAAAYAYDAATLILDAASDVGVESDDGSLSIPREALLRAAARTKGVRGITGTIGCSRSGDCAAAASVGVYRFPSWPLGGEEVRAVFRASKSLADLEPEAG